MAARRAMAGVALFLSYMAVALLCSAMAANAQVDCSAEFNAMQPCIDFVNSNVTTVPSKQCCTAFNATQVNRPVCLCQLQQAFADPATAPGNATRANEIPSLCAVAVDPSRCPGLLGLTPAVAPVAPVTPPILAPVAPVTPPILAPVAPVTPPILAPAAAGPVGADVDCSAEFNSLASCIAYVSSNTTTPPAQCCSSLLTVHLNKPVCLCQLLQQVNGTSPTAGVNATKAIDLPNVCKVQTNVSTCPALLGQPVASPVAAPPTAPVTAPVPESASVPEAGAPGTNGGITNPTAPEASPAVTTPNRNGANSIFGASVTPLAMLGAFLASSLHLLL